MTTAEKPSAFNHEPSAKKQALRSEDEDCRENIEHLRNNKH